MRWTQDSRARQWARRLQVAAVARARYLPQVDPRVGQVEVEVSPECPPCPTLRRRRREMDR